MVICTSDKSGRLLTISYTRLVSLGDMRHALETVRRLVPQLKPGFFILSDWTHLDSMDYACASELGALMDLCDGAKPSGVVRVLPDPAKDIGFNIISRFHHDPPVQTQTYETLAEAIEYLSSMRRTAVASAHEAA